MQLFAQGGVTGRPSPSPGAHNTQDPACWRFPASKNASCQGKSGGYRTLVATNKGNRWVFMFGFPKNERSNIDKGETEALKKLAAHLLSLTPQALGKAERAGELIEVDCDAKD